MQGRRPPPGEGVVTEEKFPQNSKPSHRLAHWEFWNFRGQHKREKKKNSPQNSRQMAITCGEAAHPAASARSERGLRPWPAG